MTDSDHTSSDPFAVVQRDLVAATIDLFAAYSVGLTHVYQGPDLAPRPDDEKAVMAVIGYAGETLRGTLVLLTTKEKVRDWQPGFIEPNAPPEVIHDTVGEFANMLLGRLKRALLERGVSFFMTTPATASGTRLSLPSSHGGHSAWHRFEGSAGRIDVRIDSTFDKGFAFNTAPREAAATAGDMMLF
jgi:CheY-specific phosphatase CheX